MKAMLSFYCKFLGILMISGPCFSEILVIKKGSNRTTEIIGDLPALFGPSVPNGGLKGYVVYTSPPDACERPIPPPAIPNYNGPFIALVRRYNCTFVDKVLNSQVSGYQAVIVRNVGSNAVEVMNGDRDMELVRIPSVFIGQDDGILLQENFQLYSGYYVIITDDTPFNIQNYLLPFAITIGICFILMLTLMLVKCIRDYRQTRRHRLSNRALKKLPTHKFKKGDPYECCAVCLEDYVDNDKLRILPCSHAYHTKCIDPWLTKNRRVCPVCKRKVITGDERPSDIDSDSDDETAPLINSEAGTQGGTFVQQRENPFQQAERLLERRRHEGSRNARSRSDGRYAHLNDSGSESEESGRQEGSLPPSNPSVCSHEASQERGGESTPDDTQASGHPDTATDMVAGSLPDAPQSVASEEQPDVDTITPGVSGKDSAPATTAATDCVV